MALNRSASFSMVFLAMATLLILAGQTDGRRLRERRRHVGLGLGLSGDLCQGADYPATCRAAVKSLTDPLAATRSTVKKLIGATIAAKVAVSNLGESQVAGVCKENYDDALSDLKTSLENLLAHDKGSFNSYMSAALTDFVTCDDAFSEIGRTSPLQKTSTSLRQVASNALYLATLWK